MRDIDDATREQEVSKTTNPSLFDDMRYEADYDAAEELVPYPEWMEEDLYCRDYEEEEYNRQLMRDGE